MKWADKKMLIQTRINLNHKVSHVAGTWALAVTMCRPAVVTLGCAVTLVLAGCAVPGSVAPGVQVHAGKPVRIGLALGGGAARGFAHVGVIAALEEAGFKPSLVVGTSAGSLVAALYASGKTSAQLQQTALSLEEVAITDWMLPLFGRGMFRGEALGRYVNDLVSGRLIENMAIPLGIVATDLNSGQAVLFQRGDTGTAVRASSAVPAVFVPVKINGREYVDGGLVSPVPVRFARQMGADLVIAVDISSPPRPTLQTARCRSCCKPLPSWVKALINTSSRTPMCWCNPRRPASKAQTSRRASALSTPDALRCRRRCPPCVPDWRFYRPDDAPDLIAG